jgi:hypothetical protein
MQSQIQNDIKTADNIGRQFLQAFFTPNTDIANFYGNDSILTFETEVYVGRDEIIGKLKNLQVNNVPNNYSVQPSNNGILIFCSGNFNLIGETNQMPFLRCIFLVQSSGSYYIKNDIYKITFG